MEGLALLSALLKLSDKAIWGRIVGGKLGYDMSNPTTLLCDAEAALRASMGEASVMRLRHAMRRAAIVKSRTRATLIVLAARVCGPVRGPFVCHDRYSFHAAAFVPR